MSEPRSVWTPSPRLHHGALFPIVQPEYGTLKGEPWRITGVIQVGRYREGFEGQGEDLGLIKVGDGKPI